MSGLKKRANLSKVKCVEKCVSIEHGNFICASIVRGSCDEALWFIKQRCASFATVLDGNGYSALHVATACRKNKVVSYLIASGAEVNLQHEKSGNTALHFAVLYGNLDTAHILLKSGADPNLMNKNGNSSLIWLAAQQPFKVFMYPNDVMKLQVYAWGSNANYNLGLTKQYSGGIPECIDIDVKENDDVIEICPNKYHTLFRTRKGKVYACGHGRGGRLGMNMQSSVVVPLRISFFKIKVLKISAGVDHSVFLTENHQVWTCGKNSYKQLGFDPPPDYLCTPQTLKTWFSTHPEIAKNVVGVGAGAYHTIFWTTTSIVSFGLNGGQLGLPGNEQSPFIVNPTIITSPRNLFVKMTTSAEDKIDLVHVANAAILFCTINGNVYIATNYEIQCIVLFGKLYNKKIKKLFCIGGTLDTKNKFWNSKYLSHHRPSPVTIALLSSENIVYIWYLQHSGRHFIVGQPVQLYDILDFCLNPIDMHFVKTSLHCFKLDCKDIKLYDDKKNKSKENFLNFDVDVQSNLFIQLPYLCRPYSIFCDPQGYNFFTLQYSGRTFVKNIPVVICESTYREDFLQLYDNISDSNCDIVFRTKGKTFPSHSYIISYHSNLLYKKILADWNSHDTNRKIEISVENLENGVIETILQSLYKQCPKPLKYHSRPHSNETSSKIINTSHGYLPSPDESSDDNKDFQTHIRYKSKKRKSKPKLNNFQQNVLNALKLLGFQHFIYKDQYLIMDFKEDDSTPKKAPSSTFYRHRLSNLWDIWFQCKDEDGLLGAHRCIVAARCPYFEIYFSTRWATFELGNSDANVIQIQCSQAAFKAILDYLYTDGNLHLKNLNVEVLCEVLVNSNLYLLPRLQEMCEEMLSKRATLRNCLDLLQFCHTYNAENLLHYLQEFLALNIQHFFPSRSFKDCDSDCIKEFAETYKQIIYKDQIIHQQNIDFRDGKLLFDDIDYRPNVYQTSWVDNYSEHPTCSELQQGFLDHHSDFIEAAEGWVESIQNLKHNKGKKPGSGRKRHRSTNTKAPLSENRMRTTSQSSLVSNSSNSENENEDSRDDVEQFTFDDLEERKDWKEFHEKDDDWLVVGKKGFLSMEEQMEELKISIDEKGTSISKEISDNLQCTPTSEKNSVDDSNQTERGLITPSIERTPKSPSPVTSPVQSPVTFPTIQEVMIMGVTAKTKSPHQGSSKMPKMFSLKKKKTKKKEEEEEETAIGISPSTPAWKGAGLHEGVNLADIIKTESESLKKEQVPLSKSFEMFRKAKTKTSRKLKLENETVKSGLAESPGLERKGWNIDGEKIIATPCATSSTSLPSPSKLQEFSLCLAESPSEYTSSFQSILKEEATKSNNLRQTLNKPLHLIQLEERAMAELLEFYGGAYNPDENITITRVKNSIANPMWRKS